MGRPSITFIELHYSIRGGTALWEGPGGGNVRWQARLTVGNHGFTRMERSDIGVFFPMRHSAPRRTLGIYDRRTKLQSLMGLEWAMFA